MLIRLLCHKSAHNLILSLYYIQVHFSVLVNSTMLINWSMKLIDDELMALEYDKACYLNALKCIISQKKIH